MRERQRRDLFLMIDRNTGVVLPYSKYIVIEALPNSKYRKKGKEESLSLMAERDKGGVLPTYRVMHR